MSTHKPLVPHATPDADYELKLTGPEHDILEKLRPLLALPADALLQRLRDDEELAVLMEMRRLFARHPVTRLFGPTDPTWGWIGGRSFIHAALA